METARTPGIPAMRAKAKTSAGEIAAGATAAIRIAVGDSSAAAWALATVVGTLQMQTMVATTGMTTIPRSSGRRRHPAKQKGSSAFFGLARVFAPASASGPGSGLDSAFDLVSGQASAPGRAWAFGDA